MLEKLIEAQPLVEGKVQKIKSQSEIAESASDEFKISKVAIWKYKDYSYYKGRGWTTSPIAKPDSDEKFKDKISPCFRRLLDIVNTCKTCGDLTILDDYLEAMEKVGITITINPAGLNQINQEDFQSRIEGMKDLQKGICENADALRDMGPAAEEDKLCKSTRFKKLAEEYYKLSSNCSEIKKQKIRDDMKDEVIGNLLNNRGVETVIGERQALNVKKIDINTGEILD